jgi:hypothetical protein
MTDLRARSVQRSNTLVLLGAILVFRDAQSTGDGLCGWTWPLTAAPVADVEVREPWLALEVGLMMEIQYGFNRTGERTNMPG